MVTLLGDRVRVDLEVKILDQMDIPVADQVEQVARILALMDIQVDDQMKVVVGAMGEEGEEIVEADFPVKTTSTVQVILPDDLKMVAAVEADRVEEGMVAVNEEATDLDEVGEMDKMTEVVINISSLFITFNIFHLSSTFTFIK